jgi:hypothetical protein
MVIGALNFWSCSINRADRDLELTGKWTITNCFLSKSPQENPMAQNGLNFFGIGLLSDAKGKYFEFNPDSTVNTNIAGKGGSGFCFFDKENAQLIFGKNRDALKQKSYNEVYIVPLEIKGNKMIWFLDENSTMTLQKDS